MIERRLHESTVCPEYTAIISDECGLDQTIVVISRGSRLEVTSHGTAKAGCPTEVDASGLFLYHQLLDRPAQSVDGERVHREELADHVDGDVDPITFVAERIEPDTMREMIV
jgi:hypothetical protein